MNKWTDEEEKGIIKKFKELNKSSDFDVKIFDEIKDSTNSSRSANAIKIRIYNHIANLLKNNGTYDSVGKQFNISKKQLKEIEKESEENKNNFKDNFKDNQKDNQKDNKEKKSDSTQNKDIVKTQYTNDGGYNINEEGNEKTDIDLDNVVDLGNFHHVNRIMDAVLKYYENISRLNKLKSEKIIDDDLYHIFVNKLKEFKFDKFSIINGLNVYDNINNINNINNKDDSDNIDKTEKIKTKSKSDNKSVNSNKSKKSNKSSSSKKNEKYEKYEKNEKHDKINKVKSKKYDSDSECEIEIPTTKLKKRIC
jgi:hypothetical protein